MLHYHNHTLHPRDEIHRSAGAFDHCAGHHTIGDVTCVRYLEGTENGEIDVAAANHRERVGAREKGGAGHGRDGLLAGVDQVGVHLALGWERANAEQTVLRLQRDVHAFGNVIGHKRRDADAEVDVVTVAQLLRCTLRHQLTDGVFLLCGCAALHRTKLDAFLVARALDDAIDEDARRVDLVGIKLADLDELLYLGNADFAATGDHLVEVPRGFSLNEVAGFVALPCLHERNLRRDAGFENVFLIVAILRFLALGQFGAEAGAGVEPGDPSAARPQPLGECALRDELEFEFTRQNLALQLLILPNAGGHDLLDLSSGERKAHAAAIHARIVADDGEPLHAAVAQASDEIFRDAT